MKLHLDYVPNHDYEVLEKWLHATGYKQLKHQRGQYREPLAELTEHVVKHSKNLPEDLVLFRESSLGKDALSILLAMAEHIYMG